MLDRFARALDVDRPTGSSTDFPKMWRDPRTSMRDRKRVVRLLIEDVTLVRVEALHAHVRWRGGATRSLVLPVPKCAWELRQTGIMERWRLSS